MHRITRSILDAVRLHPMIWAFVAVVSLLVVISALGQQTVMRTVCVDTETEKEQIRAILYHGIDEGMKEHIKHLFAVMARDPQGQPARAARGLEPAYLAYVHSRRAVRDWSPPLCGPVK